MRPAFFIFVKNIKNGSVFFGGCQGDGKFDLVANNLIGILEGAKAFILDLRFNGGGKDGVAMALLNHFTDKKEIVATKKVRVPKGYVTMAKIRTKPATDNFVGPVYILTSHQTASASELLVLGSLCKTNMLRIGSNTEGIFSSTLGKTLPNGWEYQLSNEVYNDLEGKNYENVGIPPDFQIDYAKDKDAFFDQLTSQLNKSHDEAIELALEQIKLK